MSACAQVKDLPLTMKWKPSQRGLALDERHADPGLADLGLSGHQGRVVPPQLVGQNPNSHTICHAN